MAIAILYFASENSRLPALVKLIEAIDITKLEIDQHLPTTLITFTIIHFAFPAAYSESTICLSLTQLIIQMSLSCQKSKFLIVTL